MIKDPDDDEIFEIRGFTPYLLNMAAERTSEAFSKIYREEFGMKRTEWRVLCHLGRYGSMSANDIVIRARIHKTKISRAVRDLEEKRFLGRQVVEEDRRSERLFLRRPGEEAYRRLCRKAAAYEADLQKRLGKREAAALRSALQKLAALDRTGEQD